MEQEQFITSSIYSFEDMREYNCLYVDKTKYLWEMVRKPKSMLFFSRPRRFGKSLTLSTLKAIFQGRKGLFKGLYIENQPYDWKAYPVIHLDMGSLPSFTPKGLEEDLVTLVQRSAYDNNIELSETKSYSCFFELIHKLNQREGKVVVLIDEYDKPILNNVEKKNIGEFQAIMKGFYSVLKTCEPYERFVFITGVGKFLKVSIFSDLNNLNDISMDDTYATLCGYTEKELKENFHKYLSEIAIRREIEYETLLQKVKKWYDGYRFSIEGENVYNPVSFAKFIEKKGNFSNYWFATGSPSILFKLIAKEAINIEEAMNKPYKEEIFTAFMPSKISLIAIMYQTGYITIKGTEKDGDSISFKLGFPNMEVEESFYRYLLADKNEGLEAVDSMSYDIRKALKNNEVDKMMAVIGSFLAGFPYNIQISNEKFYQSTFYTIFKLIGMDMSTEVCTNNGRIDAVVNYGNHIYIFEFKLNKSEDIAFNQIMEKGYYKGYQNSGKKITLIGANFSYGKQRGGLTWKKQEL